MTRQLTEFDQAKAFDHRKECDDLAALEQNDTSQHMSENSRVRLNALQFGNEYGPAESRDSRLASERGRDALHAQARRHRTIRN